MSSVNFSLKWCFIIKTGGEGVRARIAIIILHGVCPRDYLQNKYIELYIERVFPSRGPTCVRSLTGVKTVRPPSTSCPRHFDHPVTLTSPQSTTPRSSSDLFLTYSIHRSFRQQFKKSDLPFWHFFEAPSERRALRFSSHFLISFSHYD